MIHIKLIMTLLFLLQVRGVFKSVVKPASKAARIVISPSGKIIRNSKSLNKASMMLLTDDAVDLGKSVLSDEKALAAKAEEITPSKEAVAKEGPSVAKRSKSAERMKKNLDNLTKEKVEEAIEDLIFENLDRTGTLFENSVHELLNEPKFSDVSSYFKVKHGLTLKRRLDLFLLLNEREVDGFRIGRREVSRILALHSDVFAGRALAFLLIDLSEYKPIVESIKRFASKRRILLDQLEESP